MKDVGWEFGKYQPEILKQIKIEIENGWCTADMDSKSNISRVGLLTCFSVMKGLQLKR